MSDQLTIHSDMPWSEADSAHFIEVGKIHIPARDEIEETILDLIPRKRDEPFLAVELGVGGGWLSEAILEHFPAATILSLDGSQTMLREAERRLARFAGRFELRRFRLEDASWLDGIDRDVGLFVSSLVIHHLDAAGKRRLYQDLFARLGERGALLIADLVAPRSEWERRFMARRWDAEVERQSRAMTGSLEVYRRFVDDHSNWFSYPDPMDMPSALPDHIQWLMQAGFTGVDVFWARAGHAVYGGYKSAAPLDLS